VCIAANRNLQVAHCPDLEVNDLEAVWAQVHTRHHNPVYIWVLGQFKCAKS